MFCSKCGKQIADDSLFCNYCGARQAAPTTENKNSISFASTSCPNCSGQLTFSFKTGSAFCPFCGSRFILGTTDVDKEEVKKVALKIEVLLNDAKRYEKKCDMEAALQCYKDVINLDPDHVEAKEGLARVRPLNYVYLKSKMFEKYKVMELRKEYMTCRKKNGSKEIWLYRKMTDLSYFFGYIEFSYKGELSSIVRGTMDEKEVVQFIRNAQKGIYPPVDKDLLDEEE